MNNFKTEEKTLQNALKDELRTEYTKVWNGRQKMIDYCVNKTDVVVKIRDKYLFTVDKPSIETNFCFGYGYCGVSNEEEYRGAENMAEHARTHEDYFIEKNMKQIMEKIEALNDSRYIALIRSHYITKSNLVDIEYFHDYGTEGRLNAVIARYHEKGDIAFLMDDSDKAIIMQAYEEAKQHFEKRLKTYLKRYGLSKVRSWSYLVD